MSFTDFVVYAWLFPVALQILLPLVLFCGCTVMKLPALLFGFKKSTTKAEPAFAS